MGIEEWLFQARVTIGSSLWNILGKPRKGRFLERTHLCLFHGSGAEGGPDDRLIVRHLPDDRVLFEELELFLLGATPLEQLANRLEPNRPVGQGNFTGAIHLVSGVLVGQTEQADQHSNALDAPDLQHVAGPLFGVRAHQGRPSQQGDRSLLDLRDLLGVQVLILRLEGPRLDLDMNRDRLHLAVEHPHQMAVPADPHLTTRILRRNRVIRLRHFDVAVPVHRPPALLEAGEPTRRQRGQTGLFLLEQQVDLLTGRAVNAGVGEQPLIAGGIF